jgi:hypothetical protein
MYKKAATRCLLSLSLPALLAHHGAGHVAAQQPLPVSKGVYRLPYADGTSVGFVNDHTNHPTTLNRVDMAGQGGGPYTVVAAAAGCIRDIVDTNNTFCPNSCASTMSTPENDCDGDGTTSAQDHCTAQSNVCAGYSGTSGNCCERHVPSTAMCPPSGPISQPACTTFCANAPNNYVWIEHPNGEWTKYTHMQFGSVTAAGRFIGECVDAGTPLGLEGDVGIAGGPHVHFEVAVPKYVEGGTISEWFSGGWLRCDECNCAGACGAGTTCGCAATNVNRQNRIPIFCQVGFASAGGMATANPCDDACNNPVTDFSGITVTAAGSPYYRQAVAAMGNPNGDFIIRPNAGAAIRSSERVTLSPGFHAEPGSYFSASIGGCDSPGGTGE